MVHTVYSFSKDFGLSGLRCGVFNTFNTDLYFSMERLSRFIPSSNMTQKLIAALLSDSQFLNNYITTYQQRLKHSSSLITAHLDKLGFNYYKSDAGLFVLVDFKRYFVLLKRPIPSHQDEDDAFYHFLMREVKMNWAPGTLSKCRRSGWFRMCHANSDELLEEVAKRLGQLKQKLQDYNNAMHQQQQQQ